MREADKVKPIGKQGPTRQELAKAKALAKRVSPKLYGMFVARTVKGNA